MFDKWILGNLLVLVTIHSEMKHHIHLTWLGEENFEITMPEGQKLLIQTGQSVQWTSAGLRPKPLMLASLAGCTAIDVVMLMKKMRIETREFAIDVTGELTEQHPKYYHQVIIEYTFTGTNLDMEKLTRCVKLSEEKYCGVMHMFRQFAELSIRIHIHNTETQH